MISNQEFLTALFSEDAPWVHVTGFTYDPVNIPKDQHLVSWKGDYFSRYYLQPGTNQYFTISNFHADDEGQARRRKSLFKHTRVVVLDDVKEKLSMNEVSKLPSPSWILETSKGSEQWGYILNEPCTDRARIENLLDGLVANGLAPEGKDPGMKGVTRYVRLPDGVNNKASKLINGVPFKCNITLWQPFSRVTLEQLADPFMVNLDAPRRESRVDGAADVSDHPLINIPEIIHIKEVRSDGRFDITCPWVASHTDGDDSGTAVFTNKDKSIGFKCHHGSCQHRTGRDLLHFIDSISGNFSTLLKNWQIQQEFMEISVPDFITPVTPEISFLTTQAPPPPPEISFLTTQAPPPPDDIDALQNLYDQLVLAHPKSDEAKQLAIKVLKYSDDMPRIDQMKWHERVCDIMDWGKGDFKDIIKDLRKTWYGEKIHDSDFYDDVVYIKELNQFYDWKVGIFFTTDAFQNSYCHEDAEARKVALQEGRVKKVDRIDYAPKMPQIFSENNTLYANAWSDRSQSYGMQGDISRWHDHFVTMGWGEYFDHISKWMAYTIRYPEEKINHMLLFGSGEGVGKDFLLYPLSRAMGDNYNVISGEELIRDFDDHLLSTKYLHINEAELGDRREAMAVSSRLKPLAAAPPHKLRVNPKGVKPIKIRNIVNATMTTNSMMPLKLNGASRRFLALWSELNVRDENDNMKPEWVEYWIDRWNWMEDTGWQSVMWYLMNVVDLSSFNPKTAPPMTDYLRDIKEASKSPIQQTIEAFIKKRLGSFKCDILTASDMSDTLRNGEIFAQNEMYVDGRYITPIKIGMVLKELGCYTQVKAYRLSRPIRLWILRDQEKYMNMNSTDLYLEYESQMKGVLKDAQLKAVS